jgi:hypothetical protein
MRKHDILGKFYAKNTNMQEFFDFEITIAYQLGIFLSKIHLASKFPFT